MGIFVESLGIRALQVWALGKEFERFLISLPFPKVFISSTSSAFWCCSDLLCCAFSSFSRRRRRAACFCLISARPLSRPAYNYHSYKHTSPLSSKSFCVVKASPTCSTFWRCSLGWLLI